MKELSFTVTIAATKERVWRTLWNDKTFRQWAGLIDPGTYMVGELTAGSEVQFISAGGYGVTSLVEVVRQGDYLLLRHSADTQDVGEREREKQWTGGKEEYLLEEADGMTTLTITFDVPPELEGTMNASYPIATAKIKELVESEENSA